MSFTDFTYKPARRSTFKTQMLVTLCLLLFTCSAKAQQDSTEPSNALTEESVTQLKARAEAAIEDESTKSSVSEIYQQAIDQLAAAAKFEAQQIKDEESRATVDDKVSAIKSELDTPRETPKFDRTLELPDLEKQLGLAEEAKNKVVQALEDANSKIATVTARRVTIRDRLLELEKEKDDADNTTLVNPNDTPAIAQAKRINLLSRRKRIQLETLALQTELSLIDAEDVADLPGLQRSLLSRKVDADDELVKSLQTAVGEKRKKDAEERVDTASDQAAEESHPVLRALADRNVTLAKQYKDVTQWIEEIQAEVTAAEDALKQVRSDADSAREKVKSIGLTDALGKLLRKQKRTLPGRANFRTEIRGRSEKISAAQLELLELEDERDRDLSETLRRLSKNRLVSTSGIQDQAKLAINERNETLAPLVRAQSKYFDLLVEMSNKQEQIVQEIDDFESYINERVLWVRSSRPLFNSLAFDREDFWLLSPSRWENAGKRLFTDFSISWLWYAAAALFMAVLLKNRFAFRGRLPIYGNEAEKNTCISFWPTIATVCLTLFAALAWPVLVLFLSWRCSVAAGDNDILRALAPALFCVAAGYFPLDFTRLACKPKGLLESHLGWSERVISPLRAALRTFTLIGLPLVLVATLMSVGSERFGKETLERIPFIAVTISLSFFLYRLLHADRGIFREYLMQYPNGWIARLQPIWFGVAILSPLVLAGLSFFGFHYTAQQLSWRLFLTTCSLVAILVSYGVFSRWLWIQRRRLSIEQSRQRRRAQIQASEEGENVDSIEVPSVEDLRDQVKQSRSLLKTSMVGVALLAAWITWADVLPALSFLEQWPLWTSSYEVTEMTESLDGEAKFETRDIVDRITLSDVAFAMVFFVLMIAAARNIPGVLEISVLQRLPIEAAVRYAITSVVRYAIILLGVFVSCRTIGIHWDQIQWMATALTFGLAFGLQEMFANFIAGIIILFERPIRVGDIVTVDDVTGKVSKVRMRATTITNWDCKDYIVPNKDFITGRILNWTLSDKVNRIVIPIGLAYGSDKNLAIDTLTRIADEHPLIESDPGPSVTFEGFGDSTLDFVLRCYISMKNMGSRLQVVHDLHTQIDDAFREANIEIAFPQQDINVRAMPSQNLDASQVVDQEDSWKA